jgi:hypothetical protein
MFFLISSAILAHTALLIKAGSGQGPKGIREIREKIKILYKYLKILRR